MNSRSLKALSSDPMIIERLAKFMAQQCFRNTELEDLHCGTSPNSKTGDYSDVKVISPFGEIPWSQLSRLNDEEMKVLMIDVVTKTYAFLRMLFTDEAGDQLVKLLKTTDLVPYWNNPGDSSG